MRTMPQEIGRENDMTRTTVVVTGKPGTGRPMVNLTRELEHLGVRPGDVVGVTIKAMRRGTREEDEDGESEEQC